MPPIIQYTVSFNTFQHGFADVIYFCVPIMYFFCLPFHIVILQKGQSWEWCAIKGNMEERACELALYLIENRATVRAAAKKFGISKSTVHKDLSERLPVYNRTLYLQVKEILEENKAQRHIRGGMATRRKYKGE